MRRRPAEPGDPDPRPFPRYDEPQSLLTSRNRRSGVRFGHPHSEPVAGDQPDPGREASGLTPSGDPARGAEGRRGAEPYDGCRAMPAAARLWLRAHRARHGGAVRLWPGSASSRCNRSTSRRYPAASPASGSAGGGGRRVRPPPVAEAVSPARAPGPAPPRERVIAHAVMRAGKISRGLTERRGPPAEVRDQRGLVEHHMAPAGPGEAVRFHRGIRLGRDPAVTAKHPEDTGRPAGGHCLQRVASEPDGHLPTCEGQLRGGGDSAMEADAPHRPSMGPARTLEHRRAFAIDVIAEHRRGARRAGVLEPDEPVQVDRLAKPDHGSVAGRPRTVRSIRRERATSAIAPRPPAQMDTS